jgi:LAS superfamily LD-carboxypeptidase LdcB
MAAGGDALSSATALLQDALGTTPVFSTRPAEMPAVPVTDTMRAAGNGQLPDSLLSSIGQGDFSLARPAADAFMRMVNAAKRDGVTFGVNDAYRSYAEQVDIADRKGIYGQGGLAAVPGTSNHGWGLAVDLELDDRAQAWMQENAWRYGYFDDVPGESWHWTYRAS